MGKLLSLTDILKEIPLSLLELLLQSLDISLVFSSIFFGVDGEVSFFTGGIQIAFVETLRFQKRERAKRSGSIKNWKHSLGKAEGSVN